MIPSAAQRTADSVVVELLVTWGAAADLLVAPLYEAIAGLSKPAEDSPRSILIKALTEFPDLLEPEARAELVSARDTSLRDSALQDLLERTADAFLPKLESRLTEIARDAGLWALHGDVSELDEVWAAIDAVGGAGDLVQRLSAARALDRARDVLRTKRAALVEKVRRSGGGQVDDSGALAHLFETRRREELARSQDELASHRSQLATAQTRLKSLLEPALKLATELDDGHEGGHATLIRLASAGAESSLRPLAEAGTDTSARMETIREWTQILEELTAGPPDAETIGRARSRLHHGISEDLSELHSRASSVPEDRRLPAAAGLESAETELRDALGGGDVAFQRTCTKALDLAEMVRNALSVELQQAAASLRSSANRLETLLGTSAAQLATARVVTTRSHLEQVESTIAERSVAAIKTLEEVIQRELEKLQHDMALLEKHRHDHEELRRERLREEIGRYLPIAGARPAAALRGLAARIPQAAGQEIDALRKRIRLQGGEIERRVRVLAGDALTRAERLRPVDVAHGTDEGLPELLRRVKEATSGSDLEEIASAADALRSATKRHGIRRRRIFTGVAVAAVLVAGVLIWLYASSGPAAESYELIVAGVATTADVAVVASDGRPVTSQSKAANGALVVELLPGRYDVYVDEKFTGWSFRVPDDKSPVRLPATAR